jgi:hypothetical protein
MQLSSISQLVQSSPTHSPVEPLVAVPVVAVVDPGPSAVPSAAVVAPLLDVVAGVVEAVVPVVPESAGGCSPEALHATSNTHRTLEYFTGPIVARDRCARAGDILVSRVAREDIGADGAWRSRRRC